MNDDVVDAIMYAMAHTSPMALQMTTRFKQGADQAACLKVRVEMPQLLYHNLFDEPASNILLAESRIRDDVAITHMRRALKTVKGRWLRDFNNMSRDRRLHFIERVKRQYVKQYPNCKHYQDIYAAYMAERVFNELKD